jgi:hypothetical protein
VLTYFFLASSPEETGEIVHDLISLHDSEDGGSPVQEDEPTPPKRKVPVKTETAASPQTRKAGKRAADDQPVRPVSRIRVEDPLPATPPSRTPRQSKKGKGKKRQDSLPKLRASTRQELEDKIPSFDVSNLPLMASLANSRSFVSFLYLYFYSPH